MNLKLALVVTSGETDCVVRWLDEQTPITAQYSAAVQNRIKIRPHQLVALDTTTTPPTLVWRWFRGRVEYQQEGYAVVNNRLYQNSTRAPISIVQLPALLDTVRVGDELFYSHDPECVAVDIVIDQQPGHPQRIQADCYAAIEDVYAKRRENP